MSFASFLGSVIGEPLPLITVILTLGVILVNGWTDAPNAIASPVVTRAIAPGVAVIMAAVMNFLGVTLMTSVSFEVAKTVYNIAPFGNDKDARTALCAAMVSIVLWAVLAFKFGIPTSESHALVAGVTGAFVALNKSFSGLGADEWKKVVVGLIFSTFFGFIGGFIICRVVTKLFSSFKRKPLNKAFDCCQIFSSAATAFLHGAQDGQKFIGVFLLCINSFSADKCDLSAPLWLTAICSVTMAVGTSLGGKKIIKSVGMDMVSIEKYQGFSADAATALSLLFSTIFGLPVSTTHVKSTAVMGVAASRRLKSVNWRVAKDMALAWCFTFPACFFISYLMTELFITVF